MGRRPNVTVFADAAALAPGAAREVARLLSEAIEQRGVAHVCLAGGSTPRALYEVLAREHAEAVRWPKVRVWFGDERAVGPEDAESNYRMAHEALLSRVKVCSQCVYRMEAERGVEAAAAAYDARLGADLPAGRFDLVLLGMGDDAHVASLFPRTRALHERQRQCVANDVPQLGTTRITLTYPVLNAAREIRFVVAGDQKAEALAATLSEPPDPERRPAQGIVPRDGHLHWLVDRAATRLL